LTQLKLRLSLQNILLGIVFKQCPSNKLLNYFIAVGELFLQDCRRNQMYPKIEGYQNKIAKNMKLNVK